METTAQRLKKIMDEQNLTQADIIRLAEPIARRYGGKLTRPDMSQYCSGKVKPSQEKLFILAKALNVTEAYLLGYDDTSEREKELDMTVEELKFSLNMLAQHKCRIPVLGRVAAGRGLTATEEIVDYVDVSKDEAQSEEYFGLLIRGDSMEPDLRNGSVVIVRKQPTADDGDIVIAVLNGDDAVCKRFKRYGDGKIGLISINPKYEPLYFTAEEQETIPVRILGRVMEVRRKL